MYGLQRQNGPSIRFQLSTRGIFFNTIGSFNLALLFPFKMVVNCLLEIDLCCSSCGLIGWRGLLRRPTEARKLGFCDIYTAWLGLWCCLCGTSQMRW